MTAQQVDFQGNVEGIVARANEVPAFEIVPDAAQRQPGDAQPDQGHGGQSFGQGTVMVAK